MKLVIGILSTILMVILLVSASQSETITTPNLLSNNFLDGSWSGDTSSNHGSDTIAGVDKQSVSSTISVIDDGQLYQFEMNEGFTSTQKAQVWFWNSAEQSMIMSQTIVGDSGSTITQSLEIPGSCTTYNGCGYEDTGTNTIVVGTNNEIDYDITSTFNFSVPAYPNTHMGADLKNPSLTLSFTLPDFVEDFEAVNDWEEIEFKEEEIWAEEIFEQFYMDEEEFFFTSPSMSFDNYTMEYEDESIKEMDMEFEYEVFNYESEPPLEETPMMYEEVFTEDMFEDTPPKEMEEEEAVVPEEMLLEEPQENEEAEEEKELELENFSSEEAPEKLEPVLNSSDIKQKIIIDHVVVKTKIDMLKFEDALKVSLMLEAQPTLVDAVFYPSVNLYPNQLSISDNRVIYKDVQFIANDPLLVYETKLRDNRHGQYILRKQLESMKWVN
tara:strand:+ start:850 stop:2169 length:1320 start_codon:yes stop_codon:yes gene_type:complete